MSSGYRRGSHRVVLFNRWTRLSLLLFACVLNLQSQLLQKGRRNFSRRECPGFYQALAGGNKLLPAKVGEPLIL